MATLTREDILDAIKNMTVLELSQLVKDMEETFGVSAAAPMMMGGFAPAAGGDGAGAATAEPVEEQTEFDVILTGDGGKKINVIKEVRAITQLGLGEAKALVEGAPKPIKEGVTKAEAEEIKKKIEAAGAKVDIK